MYFLQVTEVIVVHRNTSWSSMSSDLNCLSGYILGNALRDCKTDWRNTQIYYVGYIAIMLLHHGNCLHTITSSNGNISALLVLCAGNSPVTGELPSQRPMTRNFDAFFDLCLNKRWCKQLKRRSWNCQDYYHWNKLCSCKRSRSRSHNSTVSGL